MAAGSTGIVPLLWTVVSLNTWTRKEVKGESELVALAPNEGTECVGALVIYLLLQTFISKVDDFLPSSNVPTCPSITIEIRSSCLA